MVALSRPIAVKVCLSLSSTITLIDLFLLVSFFYSSLRHSFSTSQRNPKVPCRFLDGIRIGVCGNHSSSAWYSGSSILATFLLKLVQSLCP